MNRVLESIAAQTYSNIETIVVDCFSSDRTSEISRSKGARVFQLDAERSESVNFGARRAVGDYIYYIGSDYLLDPNVVQMAVAVACKSGADAVVIPNFVDASQGFWSRVRLLEKESYLGDSLIEAARFFRRDKFLQIGGYDSSFVAYEEHDLHNRLVQANARIVRAEGVRETHIDEPRNLLDVARRFYYYGKTIGLYLNRYPELAKRQLTPLRVSYVRNWRSFVRHPVLFVGFIIYQAIRFAAAGLGFMQESIRRKAPPPFHHIAATPLHKEIELEQT